MPKRKSPPGIIITHQYTLPQSGGQSFGNYLNYINRNSATLPQKTDQEYIRYLSYMDNPDKNAELFTEGSDGLTADEKNNLQKQFDLAEQNGSPLWQTVISFDNDWLAANGLYDPETNLVDDQALRQYTRGAMSRIFDKEGLTGSIVWGGAIHYNTDNIHIHVAAAEPYPTRQMKTYQEIKFPKSWLDQHRIMTPERSAHIVPDEEISAGQEPKYYKGILNDVKHAVKAETGAPFFCQNAMRFDSFGNLHLSVQEGTSKLPDGIFPVQTFQKLDGKFKQSSVRQAKRYIVSEITRDNFTNKQITDIIRHNLVEPVKLHASQQFVFDQDLMKQYQAIYAQLLNSGVRPDQWAYGRNKLANLRPQLDQLSMQYIQKYHHEEYESFEKRLDAKAEDYQKTYGGPNAGRKFKQGKVRDLYQRMGNAILGTMRTMYQESRGSSKQSAREPSNRRTVRKTRASGPRYLDSQNLGAFLTNLQQMARTGKRLSYNLNNIWYKSQEQRFLEEEIAVEEGLNPDIDLERQM